MCGCVHSGQLFTDNFMMSLLGSMGMVDPSFMPMFAQPESAAPVQQNPKESTKKAASPTRNTGGNALPPGYMPAPSPMKVTSAPHNIGRDADPGASNRLQR